MQCAFWLQSPWTVCSILVVSRWRYIAAKYVKFLSWFLLRLTYFIGYWWSCCGDIEQVSDPWPGHAIFTRYSLVLLKRLWLSFCSPSASTLINAADGISCLTVILQFKTLTINNFRFAHPSCHLQVLVLICLYQALYFCTCCLFQA